MIELLGGILATGGLIWFVLGKSKSHTTPRAGIRHGDPNPGEPDELWGKPFDQHERILQRRHWQGRYHQALTAHQQELERRSRRRLRRQPTAAVAVRSTRPRRRPSSSLGLILIVLGVLVIGYFILTGK